jgi:NAD(P)-dependent dehydrogenase (short-subunit alcohol dehydrogenase family)
MTFAIVPGWTAADIPDLTGRRAVVTGATSGLGEATAVELARHGAHVVLTARDAARGGRASESVLRAAPGASVEVAALDLADLASVRAFAAEQGAEPLDLLVNNAGVMAVPARRTVDGFELQMATNHLGPFALTGLLLPALLRRPGARVVTVSSFVHWFGSLQMGDLMSEQSYDPWQAYARTKLANLLFMRELGRRAELAGLDGRRFVSAAAHPGYARTNLQYVGPRMAGRRGTEAVVTVGNALLGQSAATGALPQLRAATDPDVRSGDYFGPRGLAEQRGLPRRVRMSANARDNMAARLLWEASEDLTGVIYGALAAAGR